MRQIRDCNVAVVGGAGFLGSHLVRHLIEDRNCGVTVIDNLEAGRREFVPPLASFVHHDITGSEGYLRELFRFYRVQYVFNYAAIPYIPVSFERPLRVFDVNAMGALKVINAAHEAGVKGILQVSSAEIYGTAFKGGTHNGTMSWTGQINEGFPVTPHSSYGASKAAIDLLVQARFREAGTPCIALRQFNCVGERETHPYVVPEIMSQLHNLNPHQEETETPLIRLGNNSTRDFMYAGDAVKLACLLLECGQFGEFYNLGSEESIKIYDLAQLIAEVVKPHGREHVKVMPDTSRVRPWEIWHLQSDNTKLNEALSDAGVETPPLLPLREALAQTWKDFSERGGKWSWQ